MDDLQKKLTLFFVFGIPSLLAGIIYAVILINGNSAQDGLLGIYILFGLIPVLVILIIDRFLVRQYGNQKVNRVQLYFLLFVLLLWIVRAIANL